jgi:hypothetical protein
MLHCIHCSKHYSLHEYWHVNNLDCNHAIDGNNYNIAFYSVYYAKLVGKSYTTKIGINYKKNVP